MVTDMPARGEEVRIREGGRRRTKRCRAGVKGVLPDLHCDGTTFRLLFPGPGQRPAGDNPPSASPRLDEGVFLDDVLDRGPFRRRRLGHEQYDLVARLALEIRDARLDDAPALVLRRGVEFPVRGVEAERGDHAGTLDG